jgi:hypothetical protein
MLSGKLRGSVPRIALVVTSPPYAGVHALYHRWQVRSRKETSLPYSVLGMSDGKSESYYTLASRKESASPAYFDRLCAIYKGLREILHRKTIVAQIVGFSNPKQQLPRFREIMSGAGYQEIALPNSTDPIIRRTVPNRRWYATIGQKQGSSVEYIFLHKPMS